jgi:hypothetical protein
MPSARSTSRAPTALVIGGAQLAKRLVGSTVECVQAGCQMRCVRSQSGEVTGRGTDVSERVGVLLMLVERKDPSYEIAELLVIRGRAVIGRRHGGHTSREGSSRRADVAPDIELAEV